MLSAGLVHDRFAALIYHGQSTALILLLTLSVKSALFGLLLESGTPLVDQTLSDELIHGPSATLIRHELSVAPSLLLLCDNSELYGPRHEPYAPMVNLVPSAGYVIG